jgi:hypothetical protein
MVEMVKNKNRPIHRGITNSRRSRIKETPHLQDRIQMSWPARQAPPIQLRPTSVTVDRTNRQLMQFLHHQESSANKS